MAHAAPASKNHAHPIPLWGLFLALLALTAGEVALFEIWHATAQAGTPFIPKYVMIILLMVFTLPKAAIVMIYFMHLKFEKPFVILLAVTPLVMVFVCVVPALTDSMTLLRHGQTTNKVHKLSEYAPLGGHGGSGDAIHANDPGDHAPGGH